MDKIQAIKCIIQEQLKPICIIKKLNNVRSSLAGLRLLGSLVQFARNDSSPHRVEAQIVLKKWCHTITELANSGTAPSLPSHPTRHVDSRCRRSPDKILWLRAHS